MRPGFKLISQYKIPRKMEPSAPLCEQSCTYPLLPVNAVLDYPGIGSRSHGNACSRACEAEFQDKPVLRPFLRIQNHTSQNPSGLIYCPGYEMRDQKMTGRD